MMLQIRSLNPIQFLKKVLSMLMKRIRLLQSKILRVLLSLLMCLNLTFNVLPSPASAAPAVLVPVVGSGVVALLEALGVIAVGASGTYALTQTYPYVYDFFKNLGEDISDWTSAVPDGIYFTDGAGQYYIGEQGQISVNNPGQLVLKGNDVATSYVFPTNVTGALNGAPTGGSLTYPYVSDLSTLWTRYNPTLGYQFIPFVVQLSGTIAVSDTYYQIFPTGSVHVGRIGSDFSWDGTLGNFRPTGQDILFGVPRPHTTVALPTRYNWDTTTSPATIHVLDLATINTTYSPTSYLLPDKEAIPVDNDTWNTFPQGGVLVTEGAPVTTLEVDKDKLEDTYITPGDWMPPDDPDDEERNPFKLVPPTIWQIFDTIEDVIDFFDDGKSPNNNTTLQDYINNNYVYNTNNVEINVPERFDIAFKGYFDINADINLGGGITINVDLNDKTELPSVSEGDGENFFGADAVDVFAALTKNNPVMSTITSLFGVIDPALVSVFSVTLSLCFGLAIWKLIRG